MYTANQQVTHARFGQGTVVYSDVKKTVVDFNGIEKTLVTKFANLNGEEPQDKPTAFALRFKNTEKANNKRHNAAVSRNAFKNLSNLDKLKSQILSLNGCVFGDTNSITVKGINELFNQILDLDNNTFVKGIISTVMTTYKVSEKQAYCIARFADDNGINY